MSNQETGKKKTNQPKKQGLLQDLLDMGKGIVSPGKVENTNSDDRQMNKLKRQELLQILVNQSREIDRLRQELKAAQEQLAERELKITSSGSLAEASLKIFDVLNNAQKAADLYLENIQNRAGAGEPGKEPGAGEDAPAAAPELEAASAEPEQETMVEEPAGSGDAASEAGEGDES